MKANEILLPSVIFLSQFEGKNQISYAELDAFEISDRLPLSCRSYLFPKSERDLQSHSDCQKRCPSDYHPMAFLYDPRDAGESRPSSSSIAKTYVLASPASLPTHPYKKRLGHFLFLGFSTPYPGVCFPLGFDAYSNEVSLKKGSHYIFECLKSN